MAGLFAKFNLQGIKRLVIKTTHLCPKAGSSYDLWRRATTKFAKDSNPDCKVELVDFTESPHNLPLTTTPVAEITYEHGVTEEIEAMGFVPDIIRRISDAKDPKFFAPVEEDENWEKEMDEIYEIALSRMKEKAAEKRRRRKQQAKPGKRGEPIFEI